MGLLCLSILAQKPVFSSSTMPSFKVEPTTLNDIQRISQPLFPSAETKGRGTDLSQQHAVSPTASLKQNPVFPHLWCLEFLSPYVYSRYTGSLHQPPWISSFSKILNLHASIYHTLSHKTPGPVHSLCLPGI